MPLMLTLVLHLILNHDHRKIKGSGQECPLHTSTWRIYSP